MIYDGRNDGRQRLPTVDGFTTEMLAETETEMDGWRIASDEDEREEWLGSGDRLKMQLGQCTERG